MSTEIATVETTALVLHRTATNAAGLCRELVLKTATKIQGKRYVQVEGWQAIANAFGCVASARHVERVDDGYRATGQVIRMSDGKVIAEAEGFVGDDETTWAKRPVFARRAMAQTRAMSRACRSAFAFVVTLMDAGLETTPAEEMTHVVDAEPVRVRSQIAQPEPAKPFVRGGYAAKVGTDGEIVGERVADTPAEPARATADDMFRARDAVQRAKTVAQLDAIRAKVEKRLIDEGFYTTGQADELFLLIDGKREFLGEAVPS